MEQVLVDRGESEQSWIDRDIAERKSDRTET